MDSGVHNLIMKNQIELVIRPRAKDIGIQVRRILPWAKKRMVGPFIFLDHMGPALLKAPDDGMDVRPHPHIGLSTLTYLFEGEILHRDSLGVEQLIVPGQVNWMTAGKGISHSEREPKEARTRNRTIHGLQFWVALPLEAEDVEPSFHHYQEDVIPVIHNDQLTIKVVAGSYEGQTSGLKAYSPMSFMVMEAKGRGLFHFQPSAGHEHALYVVRGSLQVDEQIIHQNEMVVFQKDSSLSVTYEADTLFALIGGEPFPEPRYIWWNLVSSSKEKIDVARKSWQEGSFPMVPGDDEKIPAPEDKPKPVNYP